MRNRHVVYQWLVDLPTMCSRKICNFDWPSIVHALSHWHRECTSWRHVFFSVLALRLESVCELSWKLCLRHLRHKHASYCWLYAQFQRRFSLQLSHRHWHQGELESHGLYCSCCICTGGRRLDANHQWRWSYFRPVCRSWCIYVICDVPSRLAQKRRQGGANNDDSVSLWLHFDWHCPRKRGAAHRRAFCE